MELMVTEGGWKCQQQPHRGNDSFVIPEGLSHECCGFAVADGWMYLVPEQGI